MKSWFTTFLTRSIVGSLPSRRFKAAFSGAFRARALCLLCAATGRLDPLRQGWALRTLAFLVVGLAATGVGLRAQTVSEFAAGVDQPMGLAFDAAGNLYVANSRETVNTVSRVTSAGNVSQFASGFSIPGGLVFDTAGNLYVANYSSHTVSKVTPGGSVSVFASGFTGPVGLAFYDGNLYVANAGLGGATVSKVTPGGVVSTYASGLSRPLALAFDPDGNLYVGYRSEAGVSKVTPGGVVSAFVSGTSVVWGLAFYGGNLYVANSSEPTVSKVTPGGVVSTYASGFSRPVGLAFDAAGDLYVANNNGTTVSKVTSPRPTVASLSPTSGATAGGTSVVITGTNFIDVSAVKFGTTAATGYAVDSATQITAISPGAPAGTVDITVTTPEGTSAISGADQFTFVNAAPAIADLNGDSVAFTEGGSALVLDQGTGASVTDTDSANLSGGNVTVSIVTNRVAGEDALSIRHQGTGAGQIGVSGGDVSYAGTTIGTFTGGSGTNDLVVTLNANSTLTNVGALLQNLTYYNSNTGNPSTSARTVRVTVNDGDGGTSANANLTVTLTAVNDTPTDLALSATTVNHSTGVNGVVGTLSATDADDTTFTFTLVAGDGTNDAANASFNLSGTSLRANNAAALAPGTYAVRVQADDGKAAGTYAKSFTLTVVDNVAPAAPSTPNLDPASDSGTLTSDNLTTDTTPTFSGTAEAGSIVKLYQDVNEVGSAVATGGNWTITSTARPAGSHAFKATATDAAGNVSPASGSLGVIIDTDAPTVSSVGVPANGTYFSGQHLDFTVNWTESMAVTITGGAPSIAVSVGGTTQQATYLSGSGTTALVFRYTTQSGDLDSDGVAVGALALNGGAITDRAGNPATLTLSSVGSTAAVLVDAVAPTVTGRTVPANGTYKLGQNLDFTVTYSENVTVTGTPSLAVTLSTGGSVSATYLSGTGTTTLTFRYTVAGGHLDADGVAVAAAITLGGGTIKDAIGNDAQTTTLGFGDTAGVLVDGVAPTVTSSNRQTPAGTTTRATSVTYRVTFSEPVTGVDLADFALTGAATGTIASVSPVTGSETTVYDVVVNSVSGNGTLRLDLKNAGTGIADLATNAIATGYTAGQTYTIDNIAPMLGAIVRQTPATVNTSAATATWRVSFGEGVTGVDAADFVLTAPAGSGSTATGVIASVTGVVGSETTTYDVVVNVSGQGAARLDLKASGTGIADVAGNALADGGFTTGSFYLIGITNVFDTVGLLPGTTRVVQDSTSKKVAQRFTTGATAPLSLTTVAAHLGAIAGTPIPVVSVYTDNADPVGGTLVATLTNPASLSAYALNLWTSTQLLTSSTTYWLVFEDASAAGSYEIAHSAATTGGVGAWLTTYAYAHGVDFATNPQTGSLRIAIGATSTPVITSTLTASGTYGTAFASYMITATNGPTSFTTTGLPSGLSLTAGTGVISGAPTQAGSFNVSLTATNGSGTGSVSTLVLTIAKAKLTVTANDTERYVGYANPTFSVNYEGFLNGDTAAGLTTAPTATTTATTASPVGTYPITPAWGVSTNYAFSYIAGTLTVTREPPAAQSITFAPLADATLGQTMSLSATASSGLPVAFSVVGGPATLSGSTLTTTGLGLVTVRAAQAGNGSYKAAAPVEHSFQVTVGAPPVVGTPTQVPAPTTGGAATLTVPQTKPNLTYQWQRNGENLAGATGPALALNNVQPPSAGLYTYTATTATGAGGTSEPVIVGVATTEKVVGTGELVGANILHPNGATYDQLLLEGKGASFTADPAQTTRMSFVDLSGDIVQVEFSGAGSLSLVMDDASAPAPPANYNQPGVNYVRGHPGIVITGANETSNVSVISVGCRNTINQSIFRDDVTYDGVANIAFIAIQSTNGKFGGIRTGNVEYFARQGFTGVYAPGVTFTGPLYVGNIQAYDQARPVLQVGSVSDARIAGGNLAQPNREPVCVCGLTRLKFVEGRTSQGDTLPAQKNQAVLEQDGVDVTDLIVPGP